MNHSDNFENSVYRDRFLEEHFNYVLQPVGNKENNIFLRALTWNGEQQTVPGKLANYDKTTCAEDHSFHCFNQLFVSARLYGGVFQERRDREK